MLIATGKALKMEDKCQFRIFGVGSINISFMSIYQFNVLGVGTHLQQYCLQLVARNIEKLVRYSLIEIFVFRHINVPIF